MEPDLPNTFSFAIDSQFLFVCTNYDQVIRIRVEFVNNLKLIYFKEISNMEFPDLLRHTPINTPDKLAMYLFMRNTEKVKFEGDSLLI